MRLKDFILEGVGGDEKKIQTVIGSKPDEKSFDQADLSLVDLLSLKKVVCEKKGMEGAENRTF